MTRLYDEEEEAAAAEDMPTPEPRNANGLNARQLQMLKNQQLSGTLRMSASVRRVLPYEVRNALAIILAHPRDLDLPDDVRWSLEQKLEQSEDEFTRIDPVVTVCRTLNTGVCTIYLKEAVPISRLLVARALRCTYVVQITNKTKTEPQSFDDNELVIKPWRGNVAGGDRYTTFGLATLDLEGQVGEELMDQVDAHFLALGPLSPADACQSDWLEEQQDEVAALLRGEKVALKPKPKTY